MDFVGLNVSGERRTAGPRHAQATIAKTKVAEIFLVICVAAFASRFNQ